MSKWLPIESAPRDGIEILVYRPLAEQSGDKQIAVKRGVNYNNFYWPKTIPDGAEPFNFTDGACYPTHWMPLPSPPAETGDGDE